MQERRNSSALAMELCLSCPKPSKCDITDPILCHWGKLYQKSIISRTSMHGVLRMVLLNFNRIMLCAKCNLDLFLFSCDVNPYWAMHIYIYICTLQIVILSFHMFVFICIPVLLINEYFSGLLQDCSKSSALAVELLQSCTKPSIWCLYNHMHTCVNVLWLFGFVIVWIISNNNRKLSITIAYWKCQK